MTRKRTTRMSRTPADKPQTRRTLIKNCSLLLAGGTVAGPLSMARAAHVGGSDLIRIGLIGCGRRGSSAVSQALNTAGPTKLVAVADPFRDQIAKCLRGLSRQRAMVDVPKQRQFAGLDGYQHVLQADVDLVILAGPPAFRPLHFEAAIRAGKHVFMEKPVAVDAAGVRRVLAANQDAQRQNLAVAVGLQRRHEPRYRETVSQLREGQIGDIVLARTYWNGPGLTVRPRTSSQTEMEYQLRNWYSFPWLSGDHLVEQHIHNLDVINWLKGAYPVEANGQGGRQLGTGKEDGQVFDHHFVEYTYADGTKMFSQCRQNKNCWNCVAEHAHGTRGSANLSGATIRDDRGNYLWRYGRGGGGGHQREHDDLFADLRAGRIPNEGEYGALSTMTAILGRMATSCGQPMTMRDALLYGTDDPSPTDQITSLSNTPPYFAVATSLW